MHRIVDDRDANIQSYTAFSWRGLERYILPWPSGNVQHSLHHRSPNKHSQKICTRKPWETITLLIPGFSTGYNPTSGSGQEVFQMSRLGSCEVFGELRVGSGHADQVRPARSDLVLYVRGCYRHRPPLARPFTRQGPRWLFTCIT